MYLEILNKNQKELFPQLNTFKRTFYLVGGTAIALHLGHRRSVDFDLFTEKKFVKHQVREKLRALQYQQIPLFEDIDQIHLMINDVKFTFFYYPYRIEHPINIESKITIPGLITLAAMKAFALGRRAKWKDYVDLYFILKDHYSISEISKKANIIYGDQFNEKHFRLQLAFHKDIDYSEPIEYIVSPIPENEIKEFLITKTVDIWDGKDKQN